MHVLGSVPGGWTAAAGDSFVPQDRLFLRQDDGRDAGVITSEHRSCVAATGGTLIPIPTCLRRERAIPRGCPPEQIRVGVAATTICAMVPAANDTPDVQRGVDDQPTHLQE